MPPKTEAVEVFRQFAWNLAGKLAAPNLPDVSRLPRRRPRRQTGGKR